MKSEGIPGSSRRRPTWWLNALVVAWLLDLIGMATVILNLASVAFCCAICLGVWFDRRLGWKQRLSLCVVGLFVLFFALVILFFVHGLIIYFAFPRMAMLDPCAVEVARAAQAIRL